METRENTLQDLKCMLIEDGYTEANIVMRTLIKAQEQVKNCSIPDVGGNEVAGHDCYKNRWEVRSDGKRYCVKCGTKQT